MLSILIITYNREADLIALLSNMATQQEWVAAEDEILIHNNNSSDSYSNLQEFIRLHPQLPICYTEGDKNLGVAGGRNHLIKTAQNPLLLILDDDVEFVQDDALVRIKQIFEKPFFKENNTAVVTFDIRYYDTKEVQLSAFPHKDYKSHKDKKEFLSYYFIGAAHLMKKELFAVTGYYPEDYFYGMEEYDLSFRILDAGYTIGYDSSVSLLHKESPLGRMPAPEKLAMMWLNKATVAYKYLPALYYYSTAIIWGIYFLKKSGFKVGLYLNTWVKILRMRRSTQRRSMSDATMKQLRQMDARLLY